MTVKPFVLLCAAVLALSGCDSIDPDSPLGKRKAIFQDMMALSEDMGGMLRGRLPYDGPAFARMADELDVLSSQPWQYYRPVKEKHSTARDEVWQRQEQFQALARELEDATAGLKQAVSQPGFKPADLREPLKKVEQACESCHQEFRAY